MNTANVIRKHVPTMSSCPRPIALALAFVCCLAVPSAAEWTAGASIGAAHTKNSSLFIRQHSLGTDVAFRDVAFEGQSLRSPQYYDLRVGNVFRSRWGVEAEFVHLKVFTKVNQPALVTGTLDGMPVNSRELVSSVVQR
jgi:hypothetical protein